MAGCGIGFLSLGHIVSGLLGWLSKLDCYSGLQSFQMADGHQRRRNAPRFWARLQIYM